MYCISSVYAYTTYIKYPCKYDVFASFWSFSPRACTWVRFCDLLLKFELRIQGFVQQDASSKSLLVNLSRGALTK